MCIQRTSSLQCYVEKGHRRRESRRIEAFKQRLYFQRGSRKGMCSQRTSSLQFYVEKGHRTRESRRIEAFKRRKLYFQRGSRKGMCSQRTSSLQFYVASVDARRLLRPATTGTRQPREHGRVMHDTRNILDWTTKY
jgi:hypothetical protein